MVRVEATHDCNEHEKDDPLLAVPVVELEVSVQPMFELRRQSRTEYTGQHLCSPTATKTSAEPVLVSSAHHYDPPTAHHERAATPAELTIPYLHCVVYRLPAKHSM